jgi:hypothetical protein
MSVYQSLSWKSKKEYQIVLGLEAIEHGLLEVYFSCKDEDHADYHRLMHVRPIDVFEHVAGYPCPKHLYMDGAISNQKFENSEEKTAYIIAQCWKRSKHDANGKIQAVRDIMSIIRDTVRAFTGIFTSIRKRDKEGRIAQLKADCAWIANSIPDSIKVGD